MCWLNRLFFQDGVDMLYERIISKFAKQADLAQNSVYYLLKYIPEIIPSRGEIINYISGILSYCFVA
jgi:hypothetical protein